MLHTGKSISHSYLPVTCPGSSLDLSSFNLQPLKFIYTLFLRLKTYPACCCYLQAVTGSSLNLPLDKKKKKELSYLVQPLTGKSYDYFLGPLWSDGQLWAGRSGPNTIFCCWLLWDGGMNSHHLPPPAWTLPGNCIYSTNCRPCPPHHHPNTVHKGKQSFIWILRNGVKQFANWLPWFC